MLGLLLYLSTIAYIPHITIFFAFIYLIISNYKSRKYKFPMNNDVYIIIIIILLSILNRLIHIENIQSLKDSIPYIILLLPTYYIAINIKEKALFILINLIFIEAIVVILEFYFGVSTFFTSLAGYQVFEENALMYFTRPLGLSENSSDVASKLLIGILLISFLKQKRYVIYLPFLIMALVLTFNRTALIALSVFYIFIYFDFITSKIKEYKILFIKVLSIIIVISISVYIIKVFGHNIFMQFTRNNSGIELSGRSMIWHTFIEFIKSHILFGNGSYKLFIPYYEGRMAHAHNSFLELLATNGIIIFILYIFLITKDINKDNLKYVITLFLVSMGQYIIFWGISLEDIMLFYFLKTKIYKKE